MEMEPEMVVESENGSSGARHAMYAWGANTCGQLALGHTRDLPLPTLVTTRQGSEQVAPALPPTMICGGANHSLLVDAAGHLWAAGSNEHGQLGVPTPTLIIAPWTDVAVSANPAAARVPCALHWIRVPLPSDAAAIAHIAAGWAHSLVLLVSGVVIAAGDNTHGQCGTTGPRFRFEPVALLPGRTRAIAAGMRHSVALSTDGRVFAWGASRHGQCGVAISPTGSIGEIPVPASTRATGVAAGARHTLMALLYYERPGATLALAVGDNKHGQLGRPAADAGSVPVIRILDDATASDPVRHVHCGWHHSTLVTASGRVWTFGRNTHGQLGRPSGGRFDPVPRSLALPGPVHSIVAGAEHMLALVASPSSDSSLLLAWGWNEHGSCGTNAPALDGWTADSAVPVESLDLPRLAEPTAVALPADAHISLIGGGTAHTFAVIKPERKN